MADDRGPGAASDGGLESAGSVASGSPALLSLTGVSKRFTSGTVALESLSLNVREGEFLSLLGPSGCGKSTVLKIIAGLSSPSEGSIEWRETNGAMPARDALGFVFQEPTLMPWASVANNVALPLKLMRRAAADIDRLVGETLALVGLTGFEKAFPRELSGGMKMRVSIARALATRPRLLLMDEPFAALDEITRFKLNDDLARLRMELRCTIVFVTHSVYESVYLSSRILVMAARPGRILREIEVPAPLPRGEAFRRSAAYAAACEAASMALDEAIEGRAASALQERA